MIRVGLVAPLALLPFLAQAQAQAQAQQIPPAPMQSPTSEHSLSSLPAIDPTKNVLDLVGALKEMLGLLRISDKELFDAKLKGERDLSDQGRNYERMLLKAATDRLDDKDKLQAEFNERYAVTEKGRVDAIRLVDKNAADVATAQALSTATGLAKAVQDTATSLSTQQARTAEDLRKLVETTALETNRNVNQRFADVQTQFTAFGTRLSTLEQTGAEGRGTARFQDPAIAALTTEVRALAQARATTSGVDQGSTTTWALVGTIVIIVLAFGGLLLKMQPKS